MKALVRVFLFGAVLLSGCVEQSDGDRSVVVYCSVDQLFSEPVLQAFGRRTGIHVRPVYDVEATKTTGLVNRLLAEKAYPRADVFWNSEAVRTVFLKKRNVLAAYRSPSAAGIPVRFKDREAYWTGFAARVRVLIYNTDHVGEAAAPRSIFDLARAEWKGRFCLAYPLFGTTATHGAALFRALGKQKAARFFRDLKLNGVRIVDGNSMARDLVVSGEMDVGFTDTDDAALAMSSGAPVRIVIPDQKGIGALVIPNTVALIARGPNPEAGKELVDYLLSPQVERALAFSGSAQIPVRDGVERPDSLPSLDSIKAMDVDFDELADHLAESSRVLQEIFVR